MKTVFAYAAGFALVAGATSALVTLSLTLGGLTERPLALFGSIWLLAFGVQWALVALTPKLED